MRGFQTLRKRCAPKCLTTQNWVYPLVNIQKAMERSTIVHGKIHYFDWAMFNCFLYVHQRVTTKECGLNHSKYWGLTEIYSQRDPAPWTRVSFGLYLRYWRKGFPFKGHLQCGAPSCKLLLKPASLSTILIGVVFTNLAILNGSATF